MTLYIKDNKIYKTPIKCQQTKTIKIKKETENGLEEIEKVVKVVVYTTDEKTIFANGYTKYVPNKKGLTKQHYRYNKRKIKNKLVELGLWETVKEKLTADEYEDLILSEDFSFDDPLFVNCYDMLKPMIKNIDELLVECRK